MTFLKTRKTIAALAIVATGVVPLAQTAPAYGEVPTDPAQCSDVAGPRGEDVQQVVVALHAVHPGAAVVRAGCGIVTRQGVVAYASGTGLVAVDAVAKTIHEGSYEICSDLLVIFVDGSEIRDENCP
ncbi:MAG TPA: hypothetical protein VG318_01365 [Actinomycetota bacterium]|nr:hypothetical protein [Actinomycetota bacterium]